MNLDENDFSIVITNRQEDGFCYVKSYGPAHLTKDLSPEQLLAHDQEVSRKLGASRSHDGHPYNHSEQRQTPVRYARARKERY